MKRTVLVLAGLCVAVTTAYAEEPDAAAGARAFRACAACHSLEQNRNMTGPSLAGVANRKAGTLPSFTRYSDALKQSGVSWNEESLDHYLENPAQFIPGNHMTFPGIPDPQTRANIIAFLKQNGATDSKAAENGMAGGMGGMGQRPVPNLKTVAANARVKEIAYCRDTFRVTTQDGNSREFWERNLRFKTDSSDDGPAKGAPAIVAAGMMGDRASVIFSSPDEIGAFIKAQC